MSDFRIETLPRVGAMHEFDVVVDPRARFFDGHFPERPILPAVAHVLLVEALLRRAAGSDARIVTLDRFRVVRLVGPGARIAARLGLGRAGEAASFKLECDGQRVSAGSFRWAEGPP